MSHLSLRQYTTAGNATFTVLSKRTGHRYTFRVRKARSPREGQKDVPLFVGVRTGNSYVHLGTFFGNTFRHSRYVGQHDERSRAFCWVWNHLDNLPQDKVEFIPSGLCCRCGRTLTTPESVARGIGPECAGLLA